MNNEASQKAQMYFFKTENKKELLAGRTIAFLAEQIGTSNVYLTNVLNGKKKCSRIYANNLWVSASEFRPFEYYFKKEE